MLAVPKTNLLNYRFFVITTESPQLINIPMYRLILLVMKIQITLLLVGDLWMLHTQTSVHHVAFEQLPDGSF